MLTLFSQIIFKYFIVYSYKKRIIKSKKDQGRNIIQPTILIKQHLQYTKKIFSINPHNHGSKKLRKKIENSHTHTQTNKLFIINQRQSINSHLSIE